jgi:hypothetical protein
MVLRPWQLVCAFFVEPAASPRLFSANEGGAPHHGDTVPSLFLAVYALAGAGVTASVPSPARWHHLKGYTQAAITTVALTEVSKAFW